MKKAVVLLSGGLDSATTLAIAKSQGFACYCLTFDYGQRHRWEIEAAKKVAKSLGALEHRIFRLDLSQFGGSALTDENLPVPKGEDPLKEEIPITYVPARNTVFLSLALAWAEVLPAYHIFIGVNALDYAGYPDCRPEFIEAFEKVANLGTKEGVEGRPFRIETPIIHCTKKEIIEKGLSLGVDFRLTHSCYEPDEQGRPCGSCASCQLRKKGFEELGIPDPLLYQ